MKLNVKIYLSRQGMMTFHGSAVQQTYKIQSRLERVVEEHVLPRQLEQHGVVEELVDGHVLAQALSSAGLDHEFSGQVGGRLRFEGADHNALVQRIAGNNLRQNSESERQLQNYN